MRYLSPHFRIQCSVYKPPPLIFSCFFLRTSQWHAQWTWPHPMSTIYPPFPDFSSLLGWEKRSRPSSLSIWMRHWCTKSEDIIRVERIETGRIEGNGESFGILLDLGLSDGSCNQPQWSLCASEVLWSSLQLSQYTSRTNSEDVRTF